MKKKKVTIDESSAISLSDEHCKTLQDGAPVCRGMHIPKHMAFPGQDGHRTSTIEDYACQNCGPTTPSGARTPNLVATPDGHLTPNSAHHRPPHFRHHLDPSNSSLAQSILDKLHWRERIRHYTWTFFTMTMATGGIANVVYAGKLSRRYPASLYES